MIEVQINARTRCRVLGAMAMSRRNCGWFEPSRRQELQGGAVVSPCLGGRISSSGRNAWPCLWMVASGTGAVDVSGCPKQTSNTGNGKSGGTSRGIGATRANYVLRVGALSECGNTHWNILRKSLVAYSNPFSGKTLAESAQKWTFGPRLDLR